MGEKEQDKKLESKEKMLPKKEEKKLIPSEKRLKLQESFVRLQADFDNYRKRMMKEQEEQFNYANENFMGDLLSVLDSMDSFLEKTKENKEGFELIEKQLRNVLKKHGLKEMDVAGKRFSSDIAEAVMTEEVENEKEEGIIVKEIQRGFMFKDKIIRYPKVVVGKKR